MERGMTELADYLAELIHAQFENRTPEKIPEGLTMEELSRAAVENHMEYLIFGGLLRTENLPPEWKEPLKKRVMSGIFRTMTQVQELQEMESRFEAAGIVNQPMKGARMKFIYPSPQMREMSDIDVLIGQEDRKKAGEVLSRMGYALSQDIKHHEIYVKKPFMVVEAHRAMYDRTVDENQYQYFSDFSRAVLREGCLYTYDFNREDFYVYLIAHMAKHFYTMGCGIRNLLDIYVYQEKYKGEMNLKYVKQELKKDFQGIEEDLEKLQQVIDSGKIGSKKKDEWLAVGITVCAILANEVDGMEWKTLIDGNREAPVLQYKDRIIDPMKLAWSKVKAGEPCNVIEEYKKCLD